MGRLVLILGGARSGKSSHAERMARELGGRVTYVATAQPLDDEMRQRIAFHRAVRPAAWRTIEEPLDLAGAVRTATKESDVVLIDCLTLWVSNRLCGVPYPDSSAEWIAAVSQLEVGLSGELDSIFETVRSHDGTVILVSNEVGMGLVPPSPLSRAYRDLLGMVNRRIAAEAEKVLLLVAGVPVDVKRLSAELN